MVKKPKQLHPVSVSRYRCAAVLEGKVEEFTNQKILGYEFRRQTYIAYDVRDRKNGFVRQSLKWEKSWAECLVTLRHPPFSRFPFKHEINIGSIQVKKGLDQAIAGRTWFYETEKLEFKDYDEMAAFGMGWAAFVILRKSGAIPGRLTRTGCARKAVEWLNEFREWRDAGYPEDFVKREPPKEIAKSA